MNVALTKKLMDAVKEKPEVGTEERELFRWTANLITVNRRKTIVVVNDYSRYGFVLYGVKAKELANLREIILKHIVLSLQNLNIKEDIIKRYIEEAGEIQYTKTRGPRYVSRIVKACEIVSYVDYEFDESNIYQDEFSKGINRDLIGFGKNNYAEPRELMLNSFTETYGEDIIECEAAELEVTLEVEGKSVVRKVVTPINITFKDFHKIMQKLFQWENCHLHEFLIYDSHKKCILNVISEYEELMPNRQEVPVMYESQVKITDYINTKNKILYHYDYGVDWMHYIEVRKIIPNYNFSYPECIIAFGNAPYEDNVKMDDIDDVLDVEEINNRLKHVL